MSKKAYFLQLLQQGDYLELFDSLDNILKEEHNYNLIKENILHSLVQDKDPSHLQRQALQIIIRQIPENTAITSPSLTEKQEQDLLSIFLSKAETEQERKEKQIKGEEFFSQILAQFYENIGTEESWFQTFEDILARNALNELQKMRLEKMISDPKIHFSLKCLIVAALSLRLMCPQIDEFSFHLLRLFIIEGEHQVWQRALTGLILGLDGKDLRLSKSLKNKLAELQEIERVQEGIYHFYLAYQGGKFSERRKALQEYHSLIAEGQIKWVATNIVHEKYKDTNIGLLLIFAGMKHYPHFEKAQHWFLPFYAENNAMLTIILKECTQNIDVEAFAQLLEGSLSVCNIDKYALCAHLNDLSNWQVNRCFEIFTNERNELQKLAQEDENERKQIENGVFSLFLQDVFQFQVLYPKESLLFQLNENLGLHKNSLLNLLAKEEKKQKIQAEKLFSQAFEIENKREEIEMYKQILILNPQKHEAWYNLGNAYNYEGNYAEAKKCFHKAIDIKVDKLEAWSNLGSVHCKEGNYIEAKKCYQKAIAIKGDKHNAWNNLGIVYEKEGNYEEAKKCYLKAIDIKADSHEAWYNLGIVYAKEGNYKEAKKCYIKAISIKPDKEEAIFNLACVYSLEKDKANALKHLAEAIHLNPNENKQKAPKDTDFEWLWEDVDFLALVH